MSLANIQHDQSSWLLKSVILYVMMAILFVMPLKLHIHTADVAPSQAHGAAVDFAVDLDEKKAVACSEIDVSVNKLIKQLPSMDIQAVMLLVVLLVLSASPQRLRLPRLRRHVKLSSHTYFLPDYRAPPAVSITQC